MNSTFRMRHRQRKWLWVAIAFVILAWASCSVDRRAAELAPKIGTRHQDFYVSTLGDNGNDGSAEHPWRTITHAASHAKPGATIHVAPGSYRGNIITEGSGTPEARIAYISDIKWGAKLVGIGTGVLWQVNASYIDIIGFDISGPNNFGIYAGWSGTTPGYIHFLNNYIHDITNSAGCTSTGGAAIDTGSGGAGNDWFIGNVVANIGASMIGNCNTIQGIYISNANALVQNNVVSGVAGYGIQQWHAATASTIVNNTVFNNGGGILLGDGDAGALPGGSGDNYVANNICVSNLKYGIVEGGAMRGGNTYANNLLWNNPKPYSLMSGATPTGTVIADPQFVNYRADGAGDYHLTTSSPAINKGTASRAPVRHPDANLRPAGAPLNIGAY
jgi:hypothetical protein